MVWGWSSFLLQSDYFTQYKLVLAGLNICAFMWVAVQLYCFSRSYGYGGYIFWMGFGYGLIAVVVILCILGQVPKDVQVGPGTTPLFGFWFWVLFMPVAILTIENVMAQLRQFRVEAEKVQRRRIVLVLIGIGVVVLFVSINAVESFRRIPVDHFGNLVAASIWTYVLISRIS
jgi:hypothetical protein